MFRTRINWRDALAAFTVLFLALLLLWAPWRGAVKGSVLVVTTPDGAMEYSLSDDREVTVNARGVTLCIVIRDGEAFVRESTCGDLVCVHSGTISQGGDTVICAPAGVRLYVEGGDTDVDYVAG